MKNKCDSFETSSGKISHKVAGLFVFVSVFTVNSALADSKQDIAELEEFYEQVFGNEIKKSPGILNNKKQTSEVVNNKDVDLVAFYEQVFGENKNIGTKPKLATVKSTNQIKSTKKRTIRATSKIKAQSPLAEAITKSISQPKKLQVLIDDLKRSNTAVVYKKTIKKPKQHVQKPNQSLKQSKQAIVIDRKNKVNDKQRNKSAVTDKDPELVAFYELVFGNSADDINETQPLPIKSSQAGLTATVKSRSISAKSKLTESALPPKNESTAVPDKLQGLIDDLNQIKKHVENKDVYPKQQQTGSQKIENRNVFVKTDNTHSDIDKIEDKKTTNMLSIESAQQKVVSEPNNKAATTEKLQGLINDLKQDNSGVSQNERALNKGGSTAVGILPSSSQNIENPISQIQVEDESTSTTVSNTKENAKDLSDLFAKAFGKKAAKGPSEVTVELRVNKSILGEVKLFSNDAGVIDRVDTEDVLLLLKEALKEHVFVRVTKKLSTNKQTTFNSLSPLGISAFYNSTNLSLDLEIESELRKPQVISMLSKKKATVREENKLKAQDISTFANIYTNVGFDSGNNSNADLKMKLEGSVNIGGKVFETTVDYRNEQFERGRTTLTYDKPEKLQRYRVGNISTGSRNFQENLELNGIRISKEFFMDPELQIRPKANEAFVLESDSEVEVYINNQLMRRYYLKEGVYALEEIGLYDGANNIRVRIKDEFGKVTVKSSQQFYDSRLLKQGLSLYAFNVGYLSSNQAASNDDLVSKPIISGYYEKGLTKDLTLSVDAQISPDSYLLGTELISSIKLGSIRTSVALSGGSKKDTGYATSFEFKPNRQPENISLDTLRQDMLGLDTSMRDFLNSWTLSGEYRNENFSLLNRVVLNQAEPVDANIISNTIINKKLKANLQSNFSLNLTDVWRGYLNLGVSDYYDSDESYYANVSATRRFNNGIRLSLGGRYDSDDDFSMNLQLSVPLSKRKSTRKKDFDLLVDSKNNTIESKLNIKPTSLVGRNSLGGSLEHFQDDSSQQQNLDLQYRGSNFETKLVARNRHTLDNGQNSQQLNLGFNSSFACVGSSCASSYPIDDSFALVTGPSNQSNPIAINNGNNRFRYSDGNDTGLPDDYTALIRGKGKKAIVRLESYRFQNINIDESTLPNGYDTEKTEFEVFPGYHQGFLLKAGGEPATILDGVLVDAQSKPLGYKGGQWLPENGEGKTIAFFSNKAGRFRVTSIPAGNYRLELFDYPDMQAITIGVPDKKGKVHDLGNLIIK